MILLLLPQQLLAVLLRACQPNLSPPRPATPVAAGVAFRPICACMSPGRCVTVRCQMCECQFQRLGATSINQRALQRRESFMRAYM